MLKQLFNSIFSKQTNQAHQNVPAFTLTDNGSKKNGFEVAERSSNGFEVAEISFEEFTKFVCQERRKKPWGSFVGQERRKTAGASQSNLENTNATDQR
jgi:hypothetical protein